ncbi:MAG: M23 family metallopeptidase [Bacteroidota bacterium]|nr:M23 family metallopeptidase [Bacteroidota bacterium]
MARKEGSSSTWKHKYRLTLINDYTFQEVWKIKLTKLDFLSLSGSFIILLIVLVTILISFTHLREFIPGYPDGNQRRNIVLNALLLDSLQKELEMRDRYFENMRRIVSGEEPVESANEQDTSINYKDLSFEKSLEDSLLRHQIEQEEQYNLAVIEVETNENSIPDLRFFTPLKGMITSKFNVLENHYGTDIVGIPGAIIHATLDGTVILASWTLDTGYVLQIQHENNLVSVYKHNAGLLKDVGAHVEVGESIAILGDSGELYTSGPHLHFELWLNGTPIDPEKHVVF